MRFLSKPLIAEVIHEATHVCKLNTECEPTIESAQRPNQQCGDPDRDTQCSYQHTCQQDYNKRLHSVLTTGGPTGLTAFFAGCRLCSTSLEVT